MHLSNNFHLSCQRCSLLKLSHRPTFAMNVVSMVCVIDTCNHNLDFFLPYLAQDGPNASISLPLLGWTRLNNTYGAKWEASGLPQPPLDVRIIGADGQVLVAA